MATEIPYLEGVEGVFGVEIPFRLDDLGMNLISELTGGNFSKRVPEPKKYFNFDGVDDELHIDLTATATYYVSAIDPTGAVVNITPTLVSGTTYKILPIAGKLFNIKFWSDNLATDDEKKAYYHSTVPANLKAWFYCDDHKGNLAISQIGTKIGVIKNHSYGSFFYEGSDGLHSWQNTDGFNDINETVYEEGVTPDTGAFYISTSSNEGATPTGATLVGNKMTTNGSASAAYLMYKKSAAELPIYSEIEMIYTITRQATGSVFPRMQDNSSGFPTATLISGTTYRVYHYVNRSDLATRNVGLGCFSNPDLDVKIDKVIIRSKLPKSLNSNNDYRANRCNKLGKALQRLRIKDVWAATFQGTHYIAIPNWKLNSQAVNGDTFEIEFEGVLSAYPTDAKKYWSYASGDVLTNSGSGYLKIATLTSSKQLELNKRLVIKTVFTVTDQSLNQASVIVSVNGEEHINQGLVSIPDELTSIGDSVASINNLKLSYFKLTKNSKVQRKYVFNLQGGGKAPTLLGSDFFERKGYSIASVNPWTAPDQNLYKRIKFKMKSSGSGSDMYIDGGPETSGYLKILPSGLVATSDGTGTIGTGYNLLDNIWHSVDIVMSFSSTGSKFSSVIIDGNSYLGNDNSFARAIFSNITEIGQRDNTGLNAFEGELKDLKIYGSNTTSSTSGNELLYEMPKFPLNKDATWTNHTEGTQYTKTDLLPDYLIKYKTYQHRYFDFNTKAKLNTVYTIAPADNKGVKIRIKLLQAAAIYLDETKSQFVIEPTRVRLLLGTGDDEFITFDTPLVVGQYYTIYVIKSGSGLSAVVDGVTQAESKTFAQNTTTLTIDGVGNFTENSAMCVVDWIEFYDRTISTFSPQRTITQERNSYYEDGVEAVTFSRRAGLSKSFMNRYPDNVPIDDIATGVDMTPHIKEVKPVENTKVIEEGHRKSFKLDPHYYKALPANSPVDINSVEVSGSQFKGTMAGKGSSIRLFKNPLTDINKLKRNANYDGHPDFFWGNWKENKTTDTSILQEGRGIKKTGGASYSEGSYMNVAVKQLSFKAQSSRVFVGLNDALSVNYTGINYAVFIGDGNVLQYWENGTNTNLLSSTWDKGDVLKIAVEGLDIVIYKNGVEILRSNKASIPTVYPSVSMADFSEIKETKIFL